MALGNGAVFGVMFVPAQGLRGKPVAEAAFRGCGASFPTGGYVDIPVALGLVGPVAGVALALNLVVENVLLVGLSMQGLWCDVAPVAGAKLLIHPLAVWGALWLMPPVDPALRIAAVTMAAMPMLGIYPILAQKYGLEGPAAAVMLGTTVASFFSITLVLALLTSGALPWS
jgi:hypothetical protein